MARDEKLQKRFLRPKPSLQLLGDLLGFDQPLVFKFHGDVPSLSPNQIAATPIVARKAGITEWPSRATNR